MSDAAIDGCVVFPSIPFYTEARWRRTVFDSFPFLLSVTELSSVLDRTVRSTARSGLSSGLD